jgi:LuxR family maltose regulon positive regulatory protein
VLQALADERWGDRVPTALADELRPPALAQQLRGGAAAEAAAAPPPEADDGPLSQREREVLERMAAGDSNKVIARVLDISPHTVKRHVANILDKLGLASRGQAAAWFRDHGG